MKKKVEILAPAKNLLQGMLAINSGADAVCHSTKEWVEKLDLLLTNRKYSEEQVNLGQNYLTENHSESIILKKWDMVFDSV